MSIQSGDRTGSGKEFENGDRIITTVITYLSHSLNTGNVAVFTVDLGLLRHWSPFHLDCLSKLSENFFFNVLELTTFPLGG